MNQSLQCTTGLALAAGEVISGPFCKKGMRIKIQMIVSVALLTLFSGIMAMADENEEKLAVAVSSSPIDDVKKPDHLTLLDDCRRRSVCGLDRTDCNRYCRHRHPTRAHWLWSSILCLYPSSQWHHRQ